MNLSISVNRNQPPEYNHELHKYYVGDRIYRSATQIVEQFTNHFDTPERAAYMADRYGRTPEYWIQKWKENNQYACNRGTKLHELQEQFLYNQGFTSVNGKNYPVYRKNANNLLTAKKEQSEYIPFELLPDGTYPELMVWDHNWGIAGRCDKPTFETHIPGLRYVHIEDYKTNKVIVKDSFRNHETGERLMMFGPVSHLMDSNYWHYVLQLSIYQYMFEYHRFEQGIRRLIHFPPEIEGLGTPDPVIIKTPYLRNEVIAMLTHLRNTGWLN